MDSEWSKRGLIEFVSKKNSKNNKAYVKISNETLEKSVIENIKKECELHGSYLIRLSIGRGILYSSLKAVIYNFII